MKKAYQQRAKESIKVCEDLFLHKKISNQEASDKLRALGCHLSADCLLLTEPK